MIANPEVEKTVLGAMLSDSKFFLAGQVLKPSDFYLDSHRRIFVRILAIAEKGLMPDVQLLVDELRRVGELEAVGGIGFVFSLTEDIPLGSWTPESQVETIKKYAANRRILNVTSLAQAKAAAGEDPEEILEALAREVIGSQLEVATVRPKRIAEYIGATLEELASQRRHKGEVLGIASGIRYLDASTTGFRNGELTYVGAYPGRGKTAFMLQVMYHAAMAGVGVGCISLEMRASQLIKRLAVLDSGLAPSKLRDPRELTVVEYDLARKTVLGFAELPILIADQSGLSAGQISTLARQMYDMGAGIIVVDFVQIINEDGKDRREAINRVSATLRDTCKSLNVPFLVASQLARGDKDQNRRPQMQDLRESGNLEQDAHVVLLIYRPVDNVGNWTFEDEIIIAKQREGVMEHVEVAFDEKKVMFVDRHPKIGSSAA